jgi:hypothetical protein
MAYLVPHSVLDWTNKELKSFIIVIIFVGYAAGKITTVFIFIWKL